MPDWGAEGLLEGVEDDRDRDARRALLDELYDGGVPLEELRRAVAEDRLVLVPVERVLGGGAPKYTLEEFAERAGATRELAVANLRAAGVPVPADDAVVFHDEDVESLRRVKGLIDFGLPADSVFDLVRTLTTGDVPDRRRRAHGRSARACCGRATPSSTSPTAIRPSPSSRRRSPAPRSSTRSTTTCATRSATT